MIAPIYYDEKDDFYEKWMIVIMVSSLIIFGSYYIPLLIEDEKEIMDRYYSECIYENRILITQTDFCIETDENMRRTQ